MNNHKFFLYLFLSTAILLTGCAGGIQKLFWDANTSVAFEDEKKGNLTQAEVGYLRALRRARNHLTPEDISNSLYNLGRFYARQKRLPNAIKHLQESIELEEKTSGYSSVRTGKRIVALANVRLMENNINDGLPLVERLKPIASKFTGAEREWINKVLEAYKEKPEEYAKELNRLIPLVKNGDAVSQYSLGTMYEDGRGVEKNIKKAIELYKLAADQNFIEAQYYLGVIYDKGLGVPSDYVKARQWFQIAAKNGHSKAQYNYAVMLLRGSGGPVDKEKAMVWLKKSDAQGLPLARAALRDIELRQK
jgi:TPR repeat protein